MSGTKYSYAVEVENDGGWFAIVDAERRDFCLGYFHGRREVSPPRLAMRVVRSDGKVVDAFEASDRVALGMIAGFPSPEQYEAAAERAFATAADLRERAVKREARRAARRGP